MSTESTLQATLSVGRPHSYVYFISIEITKMFTDVRSIPFHAGEIVASEPSAQNQGLSVLESLAIGVCVLMLIFIYAAGIIFYVHYKQRQKRKNKDPEMNHPNNDNGSSLSSRIDMDNVVCITSLLSLINRLLIPKFNKE